MSFTNLAIFLFRPCNNIQILIHPVVLLLEEVQLIFDTNCCFRQRLVRGDIRDDIRGDKMYSISNLNGQTFIETGGFRAVKNISELVREERSLPNLSWNVNMGVPIYPKFDFTAGNPIALF